ncbi:hypothetical protein [Leifsonia sp. AG29]|uniref:hypothetical protein n=1 Tax=Leifsonia sp. AG29 TaxID=2598860 RepID=UPI00131E409E|nr:hypothetical protein [Leifsonia sp. AG29]
MALPATERIVPVTASRIELEAEMPFERLRSALEAEVPAVDRRLLSGLMREGAPWRRLVAELAGPGIHGLVRFWEEHPTPVMKVGGADTPSALYLLGEYGVMARMFRHDPGALLYAPVRLELHARGAGRTVLAFEQPSASLRTFGNNKITQAGFELDRMLGDLLEELGLPRPSVLRA